MTDKPDDSESEAVEPAAREAKKPSDNVGKIGGPMSDDAVHKTESKVNHPLGKTRHGGRRG